MEIEGLEVQLTRAEETVKLDPTGEVGRISVYRYTLGGFGPFEIRLPLEQDTDENIVAAMTQKARRLKRFMV